MILPNKLEIGDTIGVVAPSNPIINENIEELNKAKQLIESKGFKVKFSDNLFSNTNGYSASAKEKTDDINKMFSDKEVKMIWCAKGGENSNSVLDYLDCFGANFNFYIEKNRKLYTPFGGILTILSIIFSTMIFIYTTFHIIILVQQHLLKKVIIAKSNL